MDPGGVAWGGRNAGRARGGLSRTAFIGEEQHRRFVGRRHSGGWASPGHRRGCRCGLVADRAGGPLLVVPLLIVIVRAANLAPW